MGSSRWVAARRSASTVSDKLVEQRTEIIEALPDAIPEPWRIRWPDWVTKPRGRCAISPGIPAVAHAPVRCPSDFVFPEGRGSLLRPQ